MSGQDQIYMSIHGKKGLELGIHSNNLMELVSEAKKYGFHIDKRIYHELAKIRFRCFKQNNGRYVVFAKYNIFFRSVMY